MQISRYGRLLVLLTIIVAAFASLLVLDTRARETAVSPITGPAQTNVIQAGESIYRFTLDTPPFVPHADGAVAVDGLRQKITEPGAPALPFYATYVAVPPEAAVSVTVQPGATAVRTVEGVTAVPAPLDTGLRRDANPLITPDLNPAVPPLGEKPNAEIYQRDALYPHSWHTVSEPMQYRDMRLVALHLFPLRYNPVQQSVQQASRLEVTIHFEGGRTEGLRPLSGQPASGIPADAILNYDQALAWRHLPTFDSPHAAADFPTGVEMYKIELNEDGIYEISWSDLVTAGMDVDSVDPATIGMMYRGEPMAFQLVNDNQDGVFDSNEKIRFYGRAFAGPRTEKQFITNNVYWLAANNAITPLRVNSVASAAGYSPTTTFLASVTKEPENIFFATWTNRWEEFPNEPDAWYWAYMKQGDDPDPTFDIELPYPAASGPDATYLVELMTREDPISPPAYNYKVQTYINSHPDYGEATWTDLRNLNITNTVHLASLDHLTNTVRLALMTTGDGNGDGAELYLNRITVEYLRELTVTDDQLLFRDTEGGAREFQIGGFTESDSNNVLIWDISNTLNPRAFTGINRSGSGPYTYAVGSNHAAGAQFIATTVNNVKSPLSISQYVAPDLDPAGGANWIAISHPDFITPANELATYRDSNEGGGWATHVINYEDVVNQYGYGLPLPAAIRDFLAHSLTWPQSPHHVVLVGDATLNPRQLACEHPTCPSGYPNYGGWKKNEPTFVVTDLVFEDRFQGLIPSDHTFVLLTGDDLLPDMAIGRLTVDTAVEANSIITKIKRYEENLANEESWMDTLLFVADNTDSGGDFADENNTTAVLIPEEYDVIQRALPNSSQEATDNLRAEMSSDINGDGISILNYRGHGSVSIWATPAILSAQYPDFWLNPTKPVVILSADCLDGNFAFPGIHALSQTFLTQDQVGTAAHWSSTGLGFTSEHTALLTSLYNGLFIYDKKAIGDAANYAKMMYYLDGYHESEVYSFVLQGDPAMDLLRPERSYIYLPAILQQN